MSADPDFNSFVLSSLEASCKSYSQYCQGRGGETELRKLVKRVAQVSKEGKVKTTGTGSNATEAVGSNQQHAIAHEPNQHFSFPPVPEHLPEGFKDLLKSWFMAGYYTGQLDAQQGVRQSIF